MLRFSMVGTLLLLGSLAPVFATHRGAPRARPNAPANGDAADLADAERAPIAANPVGTWRLDSLIDQAAISGIDPSDVDPATFVLHDLRFDDGGAGIVPVDTPFGSGKVVAGDGSAQLQASGKAALFRIKVPKTKASDVGAIAYRVRSSDCSEVALLRDTSVLQMLNGGGGPGGPGGGNFGIPLGGGGPPIPFAGGRFGAPPAGGANPPAPAGAPPAGGNGPGAGNGPPPAPPAGIAPPPTPGGAGGPGGPGGRRRGGPGLDASFDPRDLLRGEIRKLDANGEWHTLARSGKAASGGNPMFGGMAFGGNAPATTELEELALVVLVPADKATDGVKVDLEFIHVLDAKADYASKTVAPCTVERARVLHQGMHLNTPASVTWRLVPPTGAKLVAGLTALTEQPIKLLVHVAANGARTTLLEKYFDGGSRVDPIALDLADYAGQEIGLEIEVLEENEPNVAFLLQPLVYGARKEGVRNVMLYFCDTLRADALSAYGNTRPTTPNLDALAASGIRFERCFSQGAWTYVSMPSSLSSLFPSVNGIKNGGEQIASSVITVAEAFREAGYLTAAFIRNDFVGPTTHTEQGFDFFFPGDVIGPANTAGVQQAVARMFGRNPAGADAGQGGMNFNSGSSRDLFTKVQPWLDQYRDVPFVLYMHAVDPHEPYDPETADRAKFLSDEDHAKFKEMEKKLSDFQQRQQNQFGGGGGPLVFNTPGGGVVAAPGNTPPTAPAVDPAVDPAADPTADRAEVPVAAPAASNSAAPPAGAVARGSEMLDSYIAAGIDPHDFVRKERAIYDAEVHYFDRHYKLIRDYFAQHGLTNATVFSFNADHGDEFLEHGSKGHGQSVYAELTHVPWILSAPGLLPAGKVIGDNVANLDLGPTLLGLVGLTPADSMQGRNLAAELQSGDELPAVAIFTEKWGGPMFGGGGDIGEEILGDFAVIEGRWKTVVHRTMEPSIGADGKPGPLQLKIELEIFDLLADMTDSNSLIATERERAEAANKRLETWVGEMKKLHARYAGEDTQSDNAMEMMKALGYAQ